MRQFVVDAAILHDERFNRLTPAQQMVLIRVSLLMERAWGIACWDQALVARAYPSLLAAALAGDDSAMRHLREAEDGIAEAVRLGVFVCDRVGDRRVIGWASWESYTGALGAAGRRGTPELPMGTNIASCRDWGRVNPPAESAVLEYADALGIGDLVRASIRASRETEGRTARRAGVPREKSTESASSSPGPGGSSPSRERSSRGSSLSRGESGDIPALVLRACTYDVQEQGRRVLDVVRDYAEGPNGQVKSPPPPPSSGEERADELAVSCGYSDAEAAREALLEAWRGRPAPALLQNDPATFVLALLLRSSERAVRWPAALVWRWNLEGLEQPSRANVAKARELLGLTGATTYQDPAPATWACSCGATNTRGSERNPLCGTCDTYQDGTKPFRGRVVPIPSRGLVLFPDEATGRWEATGRERLEGTREDLEERLGLSWEEAVGGRIRR